MAETSAIEVRPCRLLPLLLLLLLAGGGCEGTINEGARDVRAGPLGGGQLPGSPVPGAQGAAGSPGGQASAPSEAVRQADEAMRQANPELFDVALTYFPSEVDESPPPRLARLTRYQLELTTRTLLPDSHTTSAAQTLPADPLQTNYEYAQNLSFNTANFTPYTNWVRAVADRVATQPATVIDCGASGNDAGCLRTQASDFVSQAFRGVTSQAQLDRFVGFFQASVSEVGYEVATGDLVDLALTSPSYVFRDEVQTDAAGTLLPAQRLQALTYTLADAPPQAVGLSYESAQAQLGTADGLRSTVEQVLATPEARDKLARFFTAWLEVKEPDEFTIASEVFPDFTPELAQAIVDETRGFLATQLGAAAPTLKDLTQSTPAFVSQTLSRIYGEGGDAAQRLGIFTQPAVIASHSGPSTTRLVKRGVFFTRKVMCLPLGVPPAGVDTTVPQDAGRTERERVETVTANPQCQGCHAYINPFGFMQENYDAIGRWRTTDEGVPIDARISVDFLDEGPLMADTPVEALRGLTASLRFKQCFARQLFRFYMGRDELPGDHPILRQMFFGFADGDQQDIVQMLRVLSGSSVLSQRAEAP